MKVVLLFVALLGAVPAASAQQPQWVQGLFADSRARQVNDLVTVQVIESISATGTADSTLDKNSKAGAGVTGFFGIEKKAPKFLDPSSLASIGSNSTFKGGGSTTRSSDLTATVTARVTEVLPNGDLKLEATREIEINGDRQMVVLTGIARTADIRAGNIVLSSAIGDLHIRYFGRGLIKDNLSPGWLIRTLNKIF